MIPSGFHYSCENNHAFLVCGGESSQPEQAAAAVIEGADRSFLHGAGRAFIRHSKESRRR